MNKSFFLVLALLMSSIIVSAQNKAFTKQDTLRGSITPERLWWDLTYYHLDIEVNPEAKTISGKNTVQYKVLKSDSILQINLQPPLKITKVIQDGEELNIRHDGNAHFIILTSNQKVGSINSLDAYYKGKPKETVRAPWDGGISWKKDEKDRK